MSKKITLDWNEYTKVARQAVAEGIVLLENDGALPLKKDSKVALFGRIQNHYYKSGTGSGGMVNVDKVINIPEGLENSGHVELDKELIQLYRDWEAANPYNEGIGWGNEPWSQEEMPLEKFVAENFAAKNDVAIAIIGRTAGEDRDSTNKEGAFKLSAIEWEMLENLRQAFGKLVVVLNVGGIIDMSFVKAIKPNAVLYAWQGGMVGGDGTADVLTGKVAPSGKLPDTIAINISDHLADKNFGNDDMDIYQEDIFVGYRYFETFDKDKVMYPFGYGLTYSKFDIEAEMTTGDLAVDITAKVANVGDFKGKEVLQVYLQAPNGKLGKAARELVSFVKTKELKPGESQEIKLTINLKDFAAYDDLGVTGFRYAKVLEAGDYNIYVGTDVRSASYIGHYSLNNTTRVEQLENALYPIIPFDRYVAKEVDGAIECGLEATPYSQPYEDARRAERLPEEFKCRLRNLPSFIDVYNGNASLEDFICSLTDEDLICIIRGEGMGSSKVTPGTASAFAGANAHLMELGVPNVCCDDGPSGMRLDSGVKAFSLPNGTLLSSTFNTDLLTELYSFTAIEMVTNKVDCLLGPGMNIHRHPLNGRNFEYFSEDPYLTGAMGTAILKGLKNAGVSGTIKHFCGNNQEHRRHFIDSVISERALREIYLKGFEMAVKSGYADSIMTTYGSVNGLWTAGSYDLNTTILRNEWGFKGIVMTDWWANINRRDHGPCHEDFAQMVRSQNDLYMVCPDSTINKHNDNLAQSLEDGSLTRAELQRSAYNILDFTLKTHAMKRMVEDEDEVTVVNKPKSPDDIDTTNLTYEVVDGSKEIDLSFKESKAGTNYIFPLDFTKPGVYRVTVTASSNMSIYAQNPCTLFSNGGPVATYSFRGTDNEDFSIEREVKFYSRFIILRLYVARNGMQLKEMKIEFDRGIVHK